MKKLLMDIYHCHVLAFDSYKDLKRHCQRTGGVIPESENTIVDLDDVHENSGGMAGVIVYEESQTSDLFVAIDTQQYIKDGVLDKIDLMDAISHEMIHASYFILDGVGIQLSADNHEMMTYTQTYLLRQYLKAFKVLD